MQKTAWYELVLKPWTISCTPRSGRPGRGRKRPLVWATSRPTIGIDVLIVPHPRATARTGLVQPRVGFFLRSDVVNIRGGKLGGRRQTERGERWEVDVTKVDAYGPGAKKRCTEIWDGGGVIGWRDADEEWWENASMATVNVAWQEGMRLLVAEGEEGGAIACDAVVEDIILRMCVRSTMVEGEGVEMADGRRLTMEKGKMEMEKQTGAETAYAIAHEEGIGANTDRGGERGGDTGVRHGRVGRRRGSGSGSMEGSGRDGDRGGEECSGE